MVISGDDSLALPIIKAGGYGVISVAANAFPEKFSKCVHDAMQGNIAEAEREIATMQEPIALLFKEGNPTCVKSMTSIMGVTRDEVRLPLVEGSQELRNAIKSAIDKYELR